jgi:hypothetical protein
MVNRIAGRYGVDVYLRFAQRFTNSGERSRAVIEKESKLSGYFHIDPVLFPIRSP